MIELANDQLLKASNCTESVQYLDRRQLVTTAGLYLRDVTYILEFKLPPISEHLHLPINPAALDICSSKEGLAKVPIHHDATAHSKIHQVPLRPHRKRVKWTAEEDATLLQMKNGGCSWEKNHAALPHRSIGTIQVHYSTKLKR
jgi:hypothetical protein